MSSKVPDELRVMQAIASKGNSNSPIAGRYVLRQGGANCRRLHLLANRRLKPVEEMWKIAGNGIRIAPQWAIRMTGDL